MIANNGEQGTVGGTSAAAPLWAGFAALVNQQAAANAQPPLGFINPALYAIGRSAGFTNLFHDVSVGNNTNASSPTRFFAVPGYDLCTGWGTPTGSNLVNALLAPTDALQVGPAGDLSFSGVVGGALALAAGAIPGVDPMVALATVTFGVAAGGTGGGLVGTLIGQDFPEKHAKLYERELKAGHVLVGVQAKDRDAEAAAIIYRSGGFDATSIRPDIPVGDSAAGVMQTPY